MKKELFETINFLKNDGNKEVKIYKLQDEKFGIEIDTNCNGNVEVKRVENLTSSEDRINRVLDILVASAENFTLLEDFAYDLKDNEITL